MKLYNILPEHVVDVIKKCDKINNTEDSFEAIANLQNFIYPVKVIYKESDDYKLIITAYPLKRKL